MNNKWTLMLKTGFVIFFLALPLFAQQNGSEPVQESRKEESKSEMKPFSNATVVEAKELDAFEKENDCTLPQDYRQFLMKSNGGFPTFDAMEFKQSGIATVSDVFCFHAMGERRPWASIEWQQEAYADRLPTESIAIAHDSHGNLWLMNVGKEKNGHIAFWDHGTFEEFEETDFNALPKVADSFSTFFNKLCEYDGEGEFEEKCKSRYMMMKQAVESMKKQLPTFDPKSDSDYIWHAHPTEDGKLQLQFIPYKIHAAATHTDGYTIMRSQVGVIEPGTNRLPK